EDWRGPSEKAYAADGSVLNSSGKVRAKLALAEGVEYDTDLVVYNGLSADMLFGAEALTELDVVTHWKAGELYFPSGVKVALKRKLVYADEIEPNKESHKVELPLGSNKPLTPEVREDIREVLERYKEVFDN